MGEARAAGLDVVNGQRPEEEELADTTVRTVLSRLYDKGLAVRERRGRAVFASGGCGVPADGIRWSLLVVVIAGLALIGCSGDPGGQVSLAQLVAEEAAHDGSMVITEGTVQTYDQPRHYWIEDTEQHRVELFPPELVEDLVGHQVRVTGRFTFRDDRGRGIDIVELEVLGSPPTALPS